MTLPGWKLFSRLIPALWVGLMSISHAYGIGFDCGNLSKLAAAKAVLKEDLDKSAFATGLPPNLELGIHQPWDSGSAWISSSSNQIDGLIGTLIPAAVGTHGRFTGAKMLGGFSAMVTLEFDVVAGPVPGFPIFTAGLLSILFAVDQHAVIYAITGGAMSRLSEFSCSGAKAIAEPISAATGEMYSSHRPDLSLGGPMALEFRRYYGSFLKAQNITGSLGDNWMHNFEMKLVPGAAFVNVLLYRGAQINFKKVGSAWQLTNPEPRNYQLVTSGSNLQLLDGRDQRIYTFSSAGSLIRIEDRNGNALTVTPSQTGPSQVSDGLGRTLTFSYSAAGALTGVRDQTGRSVSFFYQGTTLSSSMDANGKSTVYTYTSAGGMTGLVTAARKPAGNTPFTQVYDSNGLAIRQSDSRGNALSIAYNTPSAATTTTTDVLQNQTVYIHADQKNLTTETDAAGKATNYKYDTGNRVTSLTDRLGNQTAMSYHDPSGYVSSVVDASGAPTNTSYFTQTQAPFTYYVPSKVTYADGTALSMTYDGAGNLLTLTDQAGKITSFTYNTRGQVLTATNPSGGVTGNVYNPDGTLASTQIPSGDTTQFTYDAQKRPVKTTYADGTAVTWTYDGDNRLTQVTDERGKVSSVAYDDNGNLLSAIDALGIAATTVYDADDRATVAKDRLGKAASRSYDALGRTSVSTNRANEPVTLSYDAVSRLSSVSDANGKATRFTWDAEGTLTSVTDPLLRTFSSASDKLGRIISVTTPLGEKTTFAYDKLGRPISQVNALSQTTTNTYDVRGLLTGIGLPAGISASYSRTVLGSISGIADPNGNTWAASFDSSNRLVSETDPLSRAVSYSYDARSRVTQRKTPEGTANFSYDSAGNLVRRLFSDGTDLRYTYDDENRVLTGDNVALTYDANGRISSSNGIALTRDPEERISSVTYAPGITVTYSYNNVGLLAEVKDWVGGSTKFTWNDAHQLVSLTRPNGAMTTYSYDKNGRLSGTVETTASAGFSIALTRDAAGKVISADRNIPQAPSVAGGALPLSYDAAHQIAGATYDGEGRLVSDGLRTYTWDLASRLTAYSGVDGAASFTYDGLGMRISRTTPDATLNYVLNYANSLPSVSIVRSGGSDLRYYIYLPGGVLLHSIEAADNSRHFYHFDETGSTLFLTGDSGEVSDPYGISPFGESISQMGSTDNPFTYSGAFGVMQEGATSLYYMRARYYDSAPARFLSKDPEPSLDPVEINPYQFARNNPMEFVDPLGAQVDLTRYYDHGSGFINEDGIPEYRPYTAREKELQARLHGLHKPLRKHHPLQHWTSPLPEEHWTSSAVPGTPKPDDGSSYWRRFRSLPPEQQRLYLGLPPLPVDKPKSPTVRDTPKKIASMFGLPIITEDSPIVPANGNAGGFIVPAETMLGYQSPEFLKLMTLIFADDILFGGSPMMTIRSNQGFDPVMPAPGVADGESAPCRQTLY